MKREEQQTQIAIIEFADLWNVHIPDIGMTRIGEYLFHIPNGGKRNKVEAAIFKAMGVRAGVWDLLLMIPTKTHHGLFMETKAGRNGLTESQIKFMGRAQAMGYGTAEVRAVDEFRDAVLYYLCGKPERL